MLPFINWGAFVRQHLAAYETLREVAFVEALPMTTTGKVMRRVLRDQERARLDG